MQESDITASRIYRFVDAVNDFTNNSSNELQRELTQSFAALTPKEAEIVLVLLGSEYLEAAPKIIAYKHLAIYCFGLPFLFLGICVLAISIFHIKSTAIVSGMIIVSCLAILMGMSVFFIYHNLVLPQESKRRLEQLLGEQYSRPPIAARSANIILDLYKDAIYLPQLVYLRKSLFRFDPSRQLASLLNSVTDANKPVLSSDTIQYLLRVLSESPDESNTDLQTAISRFLISYGYCSRNDVINAVDRRRYSGFRNNNSELARHKH